MKSIALSLFSAVLTAGCVTAYKPPPSGPTATITVLAPAEDMFGLSQNVAVVSGEQCANPTLLASFHPLKAEPMVRQVVPAEVRIYLKSGMSSSRNYPILRYCTNLVSFVPRSGATYTLKQAMLGEACAVRLLEEGERQAPQSFQVHPAKPCR